MTSTRDRILNTALDLFSEHGYEGTSVEMIASAVGIKAPSLYKHFKGKAEILDALIEKLDAYYAANFGTSERVLPRTMEDFIHMSFAKVNFTIHDETIHKTRKLLTIEQFRNPKIAELAGLHNLEGLRQMFQQLFSAMMKSGIMEECEPGILALEFVAPVSLLIQAYDRNPSKEKDIIKQIKTHMKHFAETYGKKV